MNKQAAARIAAVMRATGMSPLNAAQLVKAAQDRGLVGRLEKEAALPSFLNPVGLARGVGRMFGRGGPRPPAMPTPPPGIPHTTFHQPPLRAQVPTRAGVTPPPLPAPSPMPAPRPQPRSLLGRAAGVAGLGGAGAVGYGHLSNDADNTFGTSANPLTWGRQFNGGGPSREDIFRQNSEALDDASGPLREAMDQAIASGDMAKYTQLMQQYRSGNFHNEAGLDNPLRWRFGGLNPFGAQKGSVLQGRMQAQQKALGGEYAAAMSRSGPQAGDSELARALSEQLGSPDLLPQHEGAIRRQLEAVQRRMSQPAGVENPEAASIAARMRGAGMRVPGGRPASPTPAAPQGGSGWNLGGRPRLPGYMTGQTMMPGDFRPYAQPWDFVQSQQSPLMHG